MSWLGNRSVKIKTCSDRNVDICCFPHVPCIWMLGKTERLAHSSARTVCVVTVSSARAQAAQRWCGSTINFPPCWHPSTICDRDITTSRSKGRGSRGGIRNRLQRRGSKLPLPAITLSNVRSLNDKMIKLSALIHYDTDYRQTSLFCFTESWLSEDSICPMTSPKSRW